MRAQKSPSGAEGRNVFIRNGSVGCLGFGLGFLQTDYAVAFFPFTALFEQVDALEALEYGAVLFAASSGGFKAVVLCHGWMRVKS